MGFSITKTLGIGNGDRSGFLGLNPTALGILTGGILGGGANGALLAGIGGAIGGLYDRAQGAVRDGMSAMRKAERAGIANQNAIVEQGYQKRLGALGIGEKSSNPNPVKGNISSQQGIALDANAEGVNLLG